MNYDQASKQLRAMLREGLTNGSDMVNSIGTAHGKAAMAIADRYLSCMSILGTVITLYEGERIALQAKAAGNQVDEAALRELEESTSEMLTRLKEVLQEQLLIGLELGVRAQKQGGPELESGLCISEEAQRAADLSIESGHRVLRQMIAAKRMVLDYRSKGGA